MGKELNKIKTEKVRWRGLMGERYTSNVVGYTNGVVLGKGKHKYIYISKHKYKGMVKVID